MNRSDLRTCVGVVGCLFGISASGEPASQPGDAAALPSAIIKHVAGKDGKWFTDDDPVYHFFACAYDAKGNLVRKTCLTVGPDQKPFTADDVDQDCENFHRDEQGKVIGARMCNGPGPDGQWNTADDLVKHEDTYTFNDKNQKVKLTRKAKDKVIRIITFGYDDKGHCVKDAEYDDPGPDGKWDTEDDGLEKHHIFEFDANGRQVRSSECHKNHDGRGPDGKWFTADDVVSSTIKHVNDDKGRRLKDLKALKAGPDDKWFTDDDVLQYYSVYVYTQSTSTEQKAP